MRRRIPVPSVGDLIFAIIALVIAGIAGVRLTQSDGDLFAHLRLGITMLETRQLVSTSSFGLVSAGQPMVAPAWLAELLFASAYRLGGLAAVVSVAAVLIGVAHATSAWWLRHRGADARWVLLMVLVGVGLGATHWLARPHLFSLVGAALVIVLLESDARGKLALTALLFAAWTNLHPGVLYGIALVALYAVGDAYDARRAPSDRTLARHAHERVLMLAVAGAATLVNPRGPALHAALWRALGDASLSKYVSEYQPPTFHDAGDLVFLAAILATVVLLARSRTRIATARLLVVLASLAMGLRTARHIPLFGVTAWPLVALSASEDAGRVLARSRLFADFARTDRIASAGPWAYVLAAALLVIGANRGLVGQARVIRVAVSQERFPVAAVRAMRTAGVQGPMFTDWAWGGYLAFAWPGRPGFIDPLFFNEGYVKDYGTIALMAPGWQERLDRWQVTVALLKKHDPLVSALTATPGWQLWYSDSTAAVLRREIPRLAVDSSGAAVQAGMRR